MTNKTTKSIIFAVVLFCASCVSPNEINALKSGLASVEQRVLALEQLCHSINSEINSLKAVVAALQEGDYVTGVESVELNGKSGFRISFLKADSIYIFNGSDGKAGRDGKDGEDGADGKDGRDGVDGRDGADGKDGKDGENGSNGKDGRDGKDGENGADGYTPVIGVAMDSDGEYYWTLDGQWLLDAKGEKLRVTGSDGRDGVDGKDGRDGVDGKDGKDGRDGQDGADGKDGVTPVLKIEEDYWYVSYDNGANWIQLGKATGENGRDGRDGTDGKDGKDGKDGSIVAEGGDIFESVVAGEDFVTFTLNGGTSFAVPVYKPLGISFDISGSEVDVESGEVISIGYTLSGTVTAETVVSASSDGNYKVSLIGSGPASGEITVTCPHEYCDGFINVMVYDGGQSCLLKVIKFYEREIQVSEEYNEYALASGVCEFTVPIRINFYYELEIETSDNEPWLRIAPVSKSLMRDESISFVADANELSEERFAIVSIYSRTSSSEPVYELLVSQEGASGGGTGGSGDSGDSGDDEQEELEVNVAIGSYSENKTVELDSQSYDASKMGTGSNAGSISVTVPAGTKSLSFKAVAWKGAGDPTFTIKNGSELVAELTAYDNEGATGTGPYKLTPNEKISYSIDIVCESETTLVFSSDKRVIFWDFAATGKASEGSLGDGGSGGGSGSSPGGEAGSGSGSGGDEGDGGDGGGLVVKNAGWLELPAMNNAKLQFITHDMTRSGKKVRNWSCYYDKEALLSHWVAYPLNSSLIGSGKRTNRWGYDPKIDSKYQPHLSSGYGGSYDRGHQIPSADRLEGDSNVSTFYYTNMTPQRSVLNQKAWNNLEQKVRGWSSQFDTLYVVTGADINGATQTISDNDGKKCLVPTGYYKALLGYKKNASIGASTGGFVGIAFYYEHKQYGTDNSVIMSQSMSIDALEAKLGIDFFVNLPAATSEAVAAQVESTVDKWWK